MAAVLFTFEESIIFGLFFWQIKLRLAFFAPLQENIVEDNKGKQYFYSFLFYKIKLIDHVSLSGFPHKNVL